MTDDTTKAAHGEGAPSPPWVAILLLATVLLLGAWFYFGVVMNAGKDSSTWGVRGDAMGPFAAVLNAGALFAALWAVYQQRVEGHKSSEDTRKQLEKMSEQVAHFARAADAQNALAKSQKQLAEAQVAANYEAGMLRLSQMSNTVATLRGSLATLVGTKIDTKARGIWTSEGDRQIVRVEVHIKAERARWRRLRAKLRLDHDAADLPDDPDDEEQEQGNA